jgi:hypothetical protein
MTNPCEHCGYCVIKVKLDVVEIFEKSFSIHTLIATCPFIDDEVMWTDDGYLKNDLHHLPYCPLFTPITYDI